MQPSWWTLRTPGLCMRWCARIPYVPVHIDAIERESRKLTALILPNLGALSSDQCAAIRRFVQKGGSLFATGDTSLYNEWGDGRSDFELADLFHAHRTSPAPKLRNIREQRQGLKQRAAADRFLPEAHTYLRLSPELRGQVNGPNAGDEPKIMGKRHPVLRGFEETNILAYGGMLVPLRVDSGALVPLTFIPPFPTYPPETSWMRVPKTGTGTGAIRTGEGAHCVSAGRPGSTLCKGASPRPW